MLVRKHKFIDQKNADFQQFCSTLIVGLGNPGYTGTRHNAGSDLLRIIISKFPKKELSRNLFLVFFPGFCAFVLLEPDLMNISGNKINQIYQKLSCQNLLICTDDLDTKLGEVKKSFAVTSGGHNGIKSVIASFGHNQFWKIKIGIGRPDNLDIKEYVLQGFSESERTIIQNLEQTCLTILKDIFISF